MERSKEVQVTKVTKEVIREERLPCNQKISNATKPADDTKADIPAILNIRSVPRFRPKKLSTLLDMPDLRIGYPE